MENRVVVLSDTHLLSPDSGSDSLFPHKLAGMLPEKKEELYEAVRIAVEEAYYTILNWLRRYGPWSAVVHIGDITGGYREAGMTHSSVILLASAMRRELMQLPRAPNLFFLPGNHDVGYRGHRPLQEAGASAESFKAWHDVFGAPWWYFFLGGVLHVGVAGRCFEGAEGTEWYRDTEQCAFLRETLARYRDSPWVLYTHNPFRITPLAPIIEPHLGRLRRFVYGDFHMPAVGRVVQAAASLPGATVLPKRNWATLAACLRRSAFCPSAAPLWWPGYSFLVIGHDDGEVDVHGIRLRLPESVRELPAARAARCAWWMLAPRAAPDAGG